MRPSHTALAFALLTVPASAPMGEEEFGNKPVANQTEWPAGTLAVVNDTTRVYRQWVNGSEWFCFEGRLADRNRGLAAFGAMEIEAHEVLLLPTVGEMQSFERKTVEFDWRVFVPSGIYLAMAKRAENPTTRPTRAYLELHVGDAAGLSRLVFPENVTLLGPDDLVGRLMAVAARAEDAEASRAATYRLGGYTWLPRAVDALIEALDDPTRVEHAARALQTGAIYAKRALEALEAAEPESDRVGQAIADAIQAVEDATRPSEKQVRALAARHDAILEFLMRRSSR